VALLAAHGYHAAEPDFVCQNNCAEHAMPKPTGHSKAFTLIELLVVVSIIALLIAILVPALSQSRAHGYSTKCKAQLYMLGAGVVMYADANDGFVVPSYNLPPIPGSTTNVTGGPQQPLDGWGPIFDRDHLVPANERSNLTVFYCPWTLDIEGVKDGQTRTDPNKPRGWTDWPLRFTASGGDSSPKVATTIPEWGFNKIIRVSYWINA
jgi:prepilin-type N-terminal cleavage/methylation domain-containing protein